MCGIAALMALLPGQAGPDLGSIRAMTDAMAHRGPDAEGHWKDDTQGVALGHRRLAIIDLTEASAQPILSTCGRYAMVFNGEIYNHQALRSRLTAAREVPGWNGTGDTETLIAAIAAWGLRDALRAAQGMFALALWDRRDQVLHLARDRMGEKPLYLAELESGWACSSELKPFMAMPSFRPTLNRKAIEAYLAFGYVPESLAIFEGVRKVRPGHIFSLRQGAKNIKVTPFEPFAALVETGMQQRASADPDALLSGLERTLLQVVDEQMLSDVPLGCFLSGGVDSSLIAALMQSQHERPIRTFSIGFNEARFNEAPHAAAVARHLGTEHTEFILSEQDALDIVSGLPRIYDEPFADSSQIPTALLCRAARQEVTVALTGDGGDEVFGGYNRHVLGPALLNRINRIPRGVRRQAAKIAEALAPWLARDDGLPRRVAAKMHLPTTALDKGFALAPGLADVESLEDIYRNFTRKMNVSDILKTASENDLPDPIAALALDGAEWMMAMDSNTYLPGDILVKVDRAAMAASLETRAPFLDARVVTAAWRLPIQMKISRGKGKQVLRLLLDRHMPRELVERPKQGFAIPLDSWLRGALRSWGESLLANRELFELAGLNASAVLTLWAAHQTGRVNHGEKLWIVLVLLDWLATYSHKMKV